MARSFNGTADVIKMSLGTLSALSNPSTYAVVGRKTTDAANHAFVRLHGSVTTNLYGGLQVNASNVMRNFGASGTASSPFTVLAADDWCVLVTSKTSGTTTPRFHKQVISSGVWSHGDGDIAITNIGSAGAGGSPWLGANGTGTFLAGDIAAAAVFNYVLSDAQTETLGLTLRHWVQLQPVAMWVLDQASTATAVPDLTGNGANQASVTGTAVSSDPAAPTVQVRWGAASGCG